MHITGMCMPESVDVTLAGGAETHSTQVDARLLVICCVLIMAALLVVGAVSHGVIRHIVQTSPLWITIALGLRGARMSKWTALPCLSFWALLMIAIWSYLLTGSPRFVGGHFSRTEIAMTAIVGVSSIVGIAGALRMKTRVRALAATVTLVVLAVLQFEALLISLLPQIAHH
jgi:hypothetical protein